MTHYDSLFSLKNLTKDLIRNNLRNQFPNLDLNEQIKLLIFAKSYPDTTNLLQV